MRVASFSASVVATLSIFLGPAGVRAAGDVGPSPAPVAAAASAAVARLGFVAPTARQALSQPYLDGYAQDVRQRVARAVAVAIVPIPVERGVPLATLDTCRRLQLSGYVAPHRHWSVTETAVTVEASLSISDCYGGLFFTDAVSQTVARDENLVPQKQVDAAQAVATADLLQRFEEYERVHDATWKLLIGTGSLTGGPPSPAPPSPTPP